VKPVKNADDANVRNDAPARDMRVSDNVMFIARAVKNCRELEERLEAGWSTARTMAT